MVVDLNEEGARRVAEEIRGGGRQGRGPQGEHRRPPATSRAWPGFAVDKFGQLDILHNNAVRLYIGRVGEMSLDHFRKTVEVGLTAYFYSTQCALKVMVPRGTGSIINIGSISGLFGDYGLGAYNAIKAASLTSRARPRLSTRAKASDVTPVCPGAIRSAADHQADSVVERSGQVDGAHHSDGTLRRADRNRQRGVVPRVDESSYVNGAYIVADGGITAHTGMPNSFVGPD